jgi:hypothetical protein
MYHWRPALVLLILAPAIGEVLFGAVPLSRLPFGLLGLVGLYGGGALLIRESVRRRRLPTRWLVLLGLAYGILEEGTFLQSLFDPHYPGLDFLGIYGHWCGVNWVWSEFIVPYHAVFSIAIPIVLTELTFPDARRAPWLGAPGVAAAGALFLGNGILLALFKVGLFTNRAPSTSLWANLGAALCVVVLVASAWKAEPAGELDETGIGVLASPRRVRYLGLVAGLAWFVGLRVLLIGDGKNLPAWAVLLAGGILGAFVWWRVSSLTGWTPERTYALVAGALPTSWLLGFVIVVAGGGNVVVDLLGHLAFGILMLVGLRALHRRMRR